MAPDHQPGRAALAACVVATLAFSVYAKSLLPGVDLGDTGGFQAAMLTPEVSARQAYPLYYALASPFVMTLSPGNPARGLNLFSAVAGALAVGLLAFLVAVVTGSVPAGAAAALLLAFSLTFWTQAVIAEVYTLHLALIAGCLVALYYSERQPGWRSLIVFFAVFAVSFGNHLSMILQLVPFTIFLLATRGRQLLRPRTVAVAALVTLVAALQYLPAVASVWADIDAPPLWRDRVAAFWFDVTKADWRETMVLGTHPSELGSRIAMWAWDARQQFGIAGCAIAIVGAFRLSMAAPRWGALLVSAYLINTAFAVTYNVGDPHVFFLPGHLLTALAIGSAFVALPALSLRRGAAGPMLPSTARVVAVLLVAYAGWRAWDTWPSANRQHDRRAERLVARIAASVEDTDAILLSGLDWQSENALLYASRHDRPRVAWTPLPDVLLHLPSLVSANQRIGRRIVVVGSGAERITEAYGPLFPLVPEELPLPLAERALRIERGTPYVLTALTPVDTTDDRSADLERALAVLSGGRAAPPTTRHFQVWAGVAGEGSPFHHAADRPFRRGFSLLGDRFDVRMEAWLPVETFRRAGFGHVLRGREHLLTIERGVSLVWFGPGGSPVTSYADGLHAPPLRFSIPALPAQQVARARVLSSM